jgi:hypothetical protein
MNPSLPRACKFNRLLAEPAHAFEIKRKNRSGLL